MRLSDLVINLFAKMDDKLENHAIRLTKLIMEEWKNGRMDERMKE
jgi:hypothetical protein